MQRKRSVTLFASVLFLIAGCSGGEPAAEVAETAQESASDSVEATTTTSPFSTTTTTTTVPPSYLPLLEEPPPFEEVTLVTEDGLELYAKYWPGGPIAVLAGHDFHTASDAADGNNPRSSESELWWTGVIADAGYTVLSPDYRGHGQSPENPSIKNSPVDLKAAYEFLLAEGYETIVMAGMVGSGTAAVVLDAEDPEVEFAGIAMIWSAPQEIGLDAQRVLYGIDAPIYLVSFQNPRLERWAKLMSDEIDHLYDLVVYSPPPNGTAFTDVYGEEFVGRLVDFIDYAGTA
ncbi:MAG: hypothetical protein QNJ81_15545 [Acidimicrobiia bacterium]|nr:hypothetical protein [Acidimicrobiia bacterium]